ncbi:DNA repair metallo-beta-lactamase-domain-containing protein [Lactarius pseudohatsudake]|nr:DNA repair metallo-beta-lactamase-domain-containing protein [Lactarius pseudohatsudake]
MTRLQTVTGHRSNWSEWEVHFRLILTRGVGTPVPTIPSSYREALLDSKIYCDRRKATILRCESDPELHEMLTTDPFSANVHIVPLNVATLDRLKEYVGRWNGHYLPSDRMDVSPLSFHDSRTTLYLHGTATRRPPALARRRPLPPPSRDYRTLFGVPYSEHSSSFKLTCFALSLNSARIVRTVNVESAASLAKISTWIAGGGAQEAPA